jgi:hypothetical protein
MYKRNTEERSLNHCCRGKAININNFVCASVALFIQHAMCMRHIILSSVSCLTLKYISHYLIDCRIFGEKKLLYKKKVCFDFLSYFCLKHFSF